MLSDVGNLNKFVFIFIIFLSIPGFSAMKRQGEFQSTKVGYIQENFTGAEGQSFAKGSPSYGIELSIDSGGNQLRYYFKTRITSSIGSQTFTKSSTSFFSKYEYTSIEPELGFSFFPVSRNDKGLNIYFWGVGGVSYNNLSIESAPVSLNIKAKAQEFGSGYGAGLGFEYIILATRSGQKLLLYSEVGFRDYRAPIAGLNAFEIGGMTFSFGFGF